MRIRPIFAWYDFWIGLYWSRKDQSLYILPIPCVGLVIDFGQSPARINQRRRELIAKKYRDGLDEEETAELDRLQEEFFRTLEALRPSGDDQLNATLNRIEAQIEQRRKGHVDRQD